MNTLTDPREIRAWMLQQIYRGGSVKNDEFPHKPSPLAFAKNVLVMCERAGYSGEDTMTVLAYHALLQCESYFDRLLEFHNNSTISVIHSKY